MYIPVLSVKDYPVALGFNHDTAMLIWFYHCIANRLQKSTLSHLQILNCLEEKN